MLEDGVHVPLVGRDALHVLAGDADVALVGCSKPRACQRRGLAAAARAESARNSPACTSRFKESTATVAPKRFVTSVSSTDRARPSRRAPPPPVHVPSPRRRRLYAGDRRDVGRQRYRSARCRRRSIPRIVFEALVGSAGSAQPVLAEWGDALREATDSGVPSRVLASLRPVQPVQRVHRRHRPVAAEGDRAPELAMLPIGYCNADRSGPSRGMVSSSMVGSRHAHSGSKFAITPSGANRADRTAAPAGVRDHRAGRDPLRAAASSIASRAIRYTAVRSHGCGSGTRPRRTPSRPRRALRQTTGSPQVWGVSVRARRGSPFPSRSPVGEELDGAPALVRTASSAASSARHSPNRDRSRATVRLGPERHVRPVVSSPRRARACIDLASDGRLALLAPR